MLERENGEDKLKARENGGEIFSEEERAKKTKKGRESDEKKK